MTVSDLRRANAEAPALGPIHTTATARCLPALPRRLETASVRRAVFHRVRRGGSKDATPRLHPVSASSSSSEGSRRPMGGALKRRGVSKDDLVAILEMSKLCQTLYLHLTGLGSEDDAGIVAVLEDVYECVARVDPGMEVVPLLERCGWDTATAMTLEDSLGEEDHLITLDLRSNEDVEIEEGADPGADGGGDASSPIDKTSVGGTFDRMHAGHRLLLATASAVTLARTGTDSSPILYIGVTGDVLLTNKRHRDLIEPYDTRANAAKLFVEKTRPRSSPVEVRCGPLDDGPPLAATVEDMKALVVSAETLGGGETLQAMRKERGFEPLKLVSVGLVKGRVGKGRGDDGKVSSTSLRADDADERERRRMRGGR